MQNIGFHLIESVICDIQSQVSNVGSPYQFAQRDIHILGNAESGQSTSSPPIHTQKQQRQYNDTSPYHSAHHTPIIHRLNLNTSHLNLSVNYTTDIFICQAIYTSLQRKRISFEIEELVAHSNHPQASIQSIKPTSSNMHHEVLVFFSIHLMIIFQINGLQNCEGSDQIISERSFNLLIQITFENMFTLNYMSQIWQKNQEYTINETKIAQVQKLPNKDYLNIKSICFCSITFMSQFISIHVGQAGVQLGNACWELFCLQHGIQFDGHFSNNNDQSNFSHIFSQTSSGKLLPRCIFVDLQPTVIDQIKTGAYGKLFHPNQLISDKQDSANNFIRAHYTVGRNILDDCLDRIRKETDNCHSFQGFIITHSVGGGTGSGFTSLLQERLSVEYGKKTKINFAVFPSAKISTSPLQPYNAVLAAHQLILYSDITVILDNQANYEIFNRNLDIDRPTYSNLNRLIAQVISSLTSSVRFEGTSNMTLSSFQANLVPYPRIHFMTSSYSPIIPVQQMYIKNLSVLDITNTCFESVNTLVQCNPSQGKYMACLMTYRGDVIPQQVVSSIIQMKAKSTVRFVDWCPTGFKVCINQGPAKVMPQGDMAKSNRSCCMIANNTAISQLISRLNHKFDLMYSRRAFVHWYIGEGLQEGFFSQSRQDLAALQKDYQQVGLQTCDGEVQED